MAKADCDFEVRKRDLIRRLDAIKEEVAASNKTGNKTGEEELRFLTGKLAELKEVTRLLEEAFAAEINRNYRGVEFGHEGGS